MNDSPLSRQYRHHRTRGTLFELGILEPSSILTAWLQATNSLSPKHPKQTLRLRLRPLVFVVEGISLGNQPFDDLPVQHLRLTTVLVGLGGFA